VRQEKQQAHILKVISSHFNVFSLYVNLSYSRVPRVPVLGHLFFFWFKVEQVANLLLELTRVWVSFALVLGLFCPGTRSLLTLLHTFVKAEQAVEPCKPLNLLLELGLKDKNLALKEAMIRSVTQPHCFGL
jgi:hypothetical protein